MKKLILPLLSLAVLLSNADGRSWTDQEGRTFDGELVEVKDNIVTIRRTSDRRKFTMPISDLSNTDQNYIKQLQEDEKKAPEKVERKDVRPRTKDEFAEWIIGKEWELKISTPERDLTEYKRFMENGLIEKSINGQDQWKKGGGQQKGGGTYKIIDKRTFQYGQMKYKVKLDSSYKKFTGSSPGGNYKVAGRLILKE